MKDEIPYFIKIRGCINCSASKYHKEKTGYDYGFDHEAMVECVILCENYGFNLQHPFYDPEEAVRLAKKEFEENGNREIIKKTKEYCLWVKEKFGKYYEMMGINLDDIIKKCENF